MTSPGSWREHKEIGFLRESHRNGPHPSHQARFRQDPLGARCPCLDGNLLASSQMTSAWKMVACGGTRDQLFMQEKARQLLGRLKPSHTSRTLILS